MTGLYVVFAVGILCFRLWRIFARLQEGTARDVVSQARNDPNDPRWVGALAPQLTGRACADCGSKILMETAGKACPTCQEPLHKKGCAKRHRLTAHAPEPTAPYR